MKIDGQDWIDWLHRVRAESEAERKRLGISLAERLEQAEKSADRIEKELADRSTPGVRDGRRDA
ncbi:MAG: hypothetical protein JSU73_00970 [candidate division WOR-3 bacterium]|nr:MAG: hypothetical protein JSU73_00970 [candidate division WOR-3 bacterium]